MGALWRLGRVFHGLVRHMSFKSFGSRLFHFIKETSFHGNTEAVSICDSLNACEFLGSDAFYQTGYSAAVIHF